MLASPEKLREIAILSELLQPPLALTPAAPNSLIGPARSDSAGAANREVQELGSRVCQRLGRCDCPEKSGFRSTANGLARSLNLGRHLQGRSARKPTALLRSRQLLSIVPDGDAR